MIHRFQYGEQPWHCALLEAILAEQAASPRSALYVAAGRTWSSRKTIHGHPRAAELLSRFRDRVQEVSGSMWWELSMWANVTHQGGSVGEHDHVPNQWSGVYYLTAGAPIIFPAIDVTVAPAAGLMILFRSSELHRVGPQVSAAPRVSIAMNAKPLNNFRAA